VHETTPFDLVVDGGGSFSIRDFARQADDDMNLRVMTEMGYAATTIGTGDLYMGKQYFIERMAGAGFPAVSANVYDESTGGLLVQPYVIVKRAGKRFGIVGILDDQAVIRTKKGVATAGVTVTPPADELLKLLPDLRKKCDMIVLLAAMGQRDAKTLAETVPGIDFVIVGKQSQQGMQPVQAGGTILIMPGSRGQYITDYRLSFDADGSYTGFEGNTVALDDKVPADATIALELKEHKIVQDQIAKQAAAERAREMKEERLAEAGGYEKTCLGVEVSCRRCHVPQYSQWLDTPHAHAYETLAKAFQATNPACLRCHTTCELDLPLDGSVPVPENLRNVQCESCHGSGADHARDGSYGEIKVETCLVCHDKENSPDFDLATYLPKVMH
jgi:hypothetical protein